MSTATVHTSMPDQPVAQVPLGVVNPWTSTVFRNGQCLALASALHHLLPGSRMVAILVDDEGWFDEGWQERTHRSSVQGMNWSAWGPYAVHVLVESAEGDWVDSHGEHDREGFIEAMRDAQGPAAAVSISPEQARTLLQTFPPQHWEAGEAFAKTLLRQGV